MEPKRFELWLRHATPASPAPRSLRGGPRTRRRNPEPRGGSGLLRRCAPRNDGGDVVRSIIARESGRSSTPRRR